MALKFGELPEKKGYSSKKYAEEVAELRAHPGEWAVLFENVKGGNRASQIRRGKLQQFAPAGAFEAEARPAAAGGDGQDIWVRYVGGQEAPAA